MALTGGLSANGKPALLAIQIWKDDINKKGGLLGRSVELVFYDDQTNPATVPGIYTKLLDVDKVDLVISGYGTNLIAPLLPIAMRAVMRFSERIVVLDAGERIAEGTPDEVVRNPAVEKAYLGE